MQYRHLDELVKAALLHSGCSAEQIGSFDSHSTIEMEMSNSPNIHISKVDDDVWLWSSVMQSHPALFRHSSYALLQFVLKECVFGRTGQVQLADVDGRLELRLLVGMKALSSAESFAAALDDFLSRVEELCSLVRQ